MSIFFNQKLCKTVKMIDISIHYRLLSILDKLAENIDVNEGEEFISISSEVALSIAIQSTTGVLAL